MKKIKVLLSALAMVAAMAFVSCGGGAGDDGTSNPPAETTTETVIATGVNGTFFKWADYGITADNAADYIVRVTYTLDDSSKTGWGPGAFNDKNYENNSLGDTLNVKADGVNEIPVADIIAIPALSEGFLVNWWGTDYSTLIKVEIIKK